MYSLDGIKYILRENPPFRLFLSGNDNFVKEFIIQLVRKRTSTVTHYLKDKEKPGVSLFKSNKLYVLPTNVNVTNITGNLIKLSNKKASKTILENNNLSEIICNPLFPSQIILFIHIYCDLIGLEIPYDIKSNIAFGFKNDLEGLYNYLNIAKYYGSVDDSFMHEFDTSTTIVIDYIVNGNISFFLRSLDNIKDYFGLLWLLILKYIELGNFLDGRSKYKNEFLNKQLRGVAQQYSIPKINNIIRYLKQLHEKIMHSGLDKKSLLISGVLRIKQYNISEDIRWLI